MYLKEHINTLNELIEYKKNIKLMDCIHCKRSGCLHSHGYQKGYCEDGKLGLRRWRVICTKEVCGKTSSTLIGKLLPHHLITSVDLWDFIKGILKGLNPKAAWDATSRTFSLDTAYRLHKKLIDSQTTIRQTLVKEIPPPKTNSKNPLVQTLEHLKALFPKSDCPIAEYQWQFQRAFFPP